MKSWERMRWVVVMHQTGGICGFRPDIFNFCNASAVIHTIVLGDQRVVNAPYCPSCNSNKGPHSWAWIVSWVYFLLANDNLCKSRNLRKVGTRIWGIAHSKSLYAPKQLVLSQWMTCAARSQRFEYWDGSTLTQFPAFGSIRLFIFLKSETTRKGNHFDSGEDA